MAVLSPDVVQYAVTKMNQGRVAFQTSSPSSPNSPEFYAFQKLLRDIYHASTLSLHEVKRLRGHVHRLYTLRTTEKAAFILKCSPSREARLLRHEHKSLETEAKVIDLIKSNSRVPVPQRIAYNPHSNNAISTPFLLRSYIPGTSLAEMIPYLAAGERAEIDRVLGSYLFSISQIKERSFGLFHRVHAGTGHSTWSEAFQSLMESALRDAEDILVSLPYETIRYHVTAHKSVLDQISEPKLVAMQAGDPRNVIIDHGRSRQVVGLMDVSNVVWGDPLLAGIFSNASEDFWDGFGGKPRDDRSQRIRGLL
jgi:aminoglycoside phosphotransferase (APT) family kinase protein